MNKLDIIRAWKDELFRQTLSKEEQALLPKHPAGEIMLTTEEMAKVNGGAINTFSPRRCCSTESQVVF